MAENAQNPSFKATIVNVITTTKEGEPLMKTRGDGSKSPYSLCSAKITEGPLAGKSVWAQRTLENREGEVKDAVVKGDDVYVIASIVTDANGVSKPFFEVATSMNATDEEILAVLGIMTAEAPQPTITEPTMTETAG